MDCVFSNFLWTLLTGSLVHGDLQRRIWPCRPLEEDRRIIQKIIPVQESYQYDLYLNCPVGHREKAAITICRRGSWRGGSLLARRFISGEVGEEVRFNRERSFLTKRLASCNETHFYQQNSLLPTKLTSSNKTPFSQRDSLRLSSRFCKRSPGQAVRITKHAKFEFDEPKISN